MPRRELGSFVTALKADEVYRIGAVAEVGGAGTFDVPSVSRIIRSVSLARRLNDDSAG